MVLDCVILVLLVLIQLPKKEAGGGLAFGAGGADALFGAGSGTMLTKITKYAATGVFRPGHHSVPDAKRLLQSACQRVRRQSRKASRAAIHCLAPGCYAGHTCSVKHTRWCIRHVSNPADDPNEYPREPGPGTGGNECSRIYQCRSPAEVARWQIDSIIGLHSDHGIAGGRHHMASESQKIRANKIAAKVSSLTPAASPR